PISSPPVQNRAAQATASASTAAAANASQPFGRSLGDDFIRIPRRIVRTEPVRDARSRQQPAVLCHQDQVKVIDAAAPELQRPVLPHDEQGRGEGVAHRAVARGPIRHHGDGGKSALRRAAGGRINDMVIELSIFLK
ncbi:Nitrogenase cofactor biosynthesis protein NifB, partial [Dysosmobacter welbionis]